MALVHVEFDWDDVFGECYDCGLPAAYAARQHGLTMLCSVCAAGWAANGEQIEYLFAETELADNLKYLS
jgi:hypothetical protein